MGRNDKRKYMKGIVRSVLKERRHHGIREKIKL